MNLRNDNPADRVRPVLGPQRNIVEHMRALPHREVAAALATVRASGKKPVDKLAFEFLVLTAARSGEVRFATWEEMDTAGRVWTLSAQRMKMKRDHRVPLCGRAVEVLDEARTLGDGPLVFPTPGTGRPLDVMRFRRLLARCRIDCVPHGFRSSFRDWAAEETDHPREVIEAALAHVVQNQVEAAYARSDLFERRRRLMDDWADYLAEPPSPGARCHRNCPGRAWPFRVEGGSVRELPDHEPCRRSRVGGLATVTTGDSVGAGLRSRR